MNDLINYNGKSNLELMTVKKLKKEYLKDKEENEFNIVRGFLKIIIYRIQFNVISEEEFRIKDILIDYWSILSDRIRRKIGKVFSHLVSNGQVLNVKYCYSTNNATIYQKL